MSSNTPTPIPLEFPEISAHIKIVQDYIDYTNRHATETLWGTKNGEVWYEKYIQANDWLEDHFKID